MMSVEIMMEITNRISDRNHLTRENVERRKKLDENHKQDLLWKSPYESERESHNTLQLFLPQAASLSAVSPSNIIHCSPWWL